MLETYLEGTFQFLERRFIVAPPSFKNRNFQGQVVDADSLKEKGVNNPIEHVFIEYQKAIVEGKLRLYVRREIHQRLQTYLSERTDIWGTQDRTGDMLL